VQALAAVGALRSVLRFMPVNIRKMTNQELQEAGVPEPVIKKFRRTNVLQLLRVDPAVIAKWHPSTLESYRVTGLTLTERRALHEHLSKAHNIWTQKQSNTLSASGNGGDPMNSRKLAWYQAMRTNFKEALTKYQRHVEECPTTASPFHNKNHWHRPSCRCNLIGNQCPVRANLAPINYFSRSASTQLMCFPTTGDSEEVYETPMKVVGYNDEQGKQKSPAEIIAESRRGGASCSEHEYEYTHQNNGTSDNDDRSSSVPSSTRIPKKQHSPVSLPTILPTTRKREKPENRPMNGLLAAIAARRID